MLSARVQFLRITVPADIYSSGIVCEASGIDIHVKALSEESQGTGKDAKQCHPSAHQGSAHDLGGEQILPRAADLAESFLETEPKEEKEELEAAISSQSQYLKREPSAVGDEEDLGLGDERVSLPSFVARFLKGITDRLRVEVKDISIRLDMELKQDGMSKRQPEDQPDLVSGLLSIGDVSVNAVSTPDETDGSPFRKEGRRLITLSDVNVSLISDPMVFSNYSRFAAPPSPSTTMQSKEGQPWSRSRSPSPSPSRLSRSGSALNMTRSTILERSLESEHPHDTESRDIEPPRDIITPDTEPMEGSTYSLDGRFSDADTDYGERNDEVLGHSPSSANGHCDDRVLDDPSYLDSVLDFQPSGNGIEDSTAFPQEELQHPQPLSSSEKATSEHGIDRSRTSIGGSQEFRTQSSPRISVVSHGDDVHMDDTTVGHPPSSVQGRVHSSLETNVHETSQSHNPSPLSDAGSTDSQSGSSNDDLSESRLYSHDEAQSMYMSAVSHGSASESFMPALPGAWVSGRSFRDNAIQGHPADPVNADQEQEGRFSYKEQAETEPSTPKLTAQSISFSKEQSGPASETPRPFAPDLNKFMVAKKFFEIDKISLWFPSTDNDVAETDEQSVELNEKAAESDLGDSSSPNLRDSIVEDGLLGSKVYSSFRIHKGSMESSQLTEIIEQSLPRHSEYDKQLRPDADSAYPNVEIEVSSVAAQFDIATGWLLAKMGQRILHTFGGNNEEFHGPKHYSDAAQSRTFCILGLSKLSVRFVEHLPGFPLENSRLYSSSYPSTLEDVILRISSSGWKTNLSLENGTSKLRLDVSKFAFGFATEDLVSFNEGLKMRESVRDVLSPVHADISLSVVKSSDSAKVIATTLPLHLSLNIQRLEEVLGWVGGLSTILELGSSISSVSTMKGTRSEPKKRSRGVRFESHPPSARDKCRTNSAPWKVNVRVGGVVVDVVGETYFKLKTTALKAVSRSEGIGVQIDKAKLTGPFLPNDAYDAAPAKVTFDNIRVEYLFTPKEADLDRLLALITPSKDRYEQDDDILLDTLFKQRKQGAVLRVTVSTMKTALCRIDTLDSISQFVNELGALSTVTKYLPEDDRPGILTLVLVKQLDGQVQVGGQVGLIDMKLQNMEVAHISIPSLIAARVGAATVNRNETEELLGPALPLGEGHDLPQTQQPVLMARFIADEMDPTVKIKLFDLRAEYTLPAMIAFLGINNEVATGNVAAGMAQSLADLGDLQSSQQGQAHISRRLSTKSERTGGSMKPARIEVFLCDCLLGLNPRDTPAKGFVMFTNARFSGAINDNEQSEVTLDLSKASLMVIDDIRNVGYTDNLRRRGATAARRSQDQSLIDMGYVPVSTISSATAIVKIIPLDDGTKSLDVELRDSLLILESCADSTQTLISILNGLQPPTPPSTTLKYRTEVMPIQDMLQSFTGDAYTAEPVLNQENIPETISEFDKVHGNEEYLDDELDYVSDFHPTIPTEGGLLAESMTASALAPSTSEALLDSFHSQYYVSSSVSELDFQEDHFSKQSAVGGTAHRWDSTHNTYGLSNESKLRRSPLRVRVRDVHVIWNLFDGYDWQRTRDTISKAVKDVEIKATERRARAANRTSPGPGEEEESVIGDFLFNSIYIGIPANRDPRELHQDINRDIDDLASETGSYATSTTVTAMTSRRAVSPHRRKKLRLSRSRHHKMTFELKGICADFVVFPLDSGETQSSLDVRIKDLDIFDHVATSTWKKFATYMREAGDKESGTSMVHLEVLTVKPIPELAASEIVLKVRSQATTTDESQALTSVTLQATVLPLRLHVDQDALDFMCRFFEFRDESSPAPNAPGDVPFLQRVEVNAVQVRLDFKPKRVDYAGLRSGRTTEFMNFFVLDGADMVLRHVIIYGVSGFDKLGSTLNDIWMPDIKRNQLPGVLAGLAPIRSLVNVGGGFKDLVVIPMREYRKDGRVVRSIQKGALSFAKTTSSELVKLGAKLAIGTQTVLQGAEDFLNAPGTQFTGLEEGVVDEEETNKISPYADQPVGVVQGLRGAFRGLERDLLLTRDAIVAVPGEVVEGGTAKAAAKAVLKRTPTIILRPAIGMSRAVGQTLLGAGNTLDPTNRRKMEDVCFSYLFPFTLSILGCRANLISFCRNTSTIRSDGFDQQQLKLTILVSRPLSDP